MVCPEELLAKVNLHNAWLFGDDSRSLFWQTVGGGEVLFFLVNSFLITVTDHAASYGRHFSCQEDLIAF